MVVACSIELLCAVFKCNSVLTRFSLIPCNSIHIDNGTVMTMKLSKCHLEATQSDSSRMRAFYCNHDNNHTFLGGLGGASGSKNSVGETAAVCMMPPPPLLRSVVPRGHSDHMHVLFKRRQGVSCCSCATKSDRISSFYSAL